MLFKYYLIVLGWIIGNHFATANNIQLLNAPRASSPDNLHFLPRSRSNTAIARRGTVFKNSTTLDKSWSGAALFSFQAKTTTKGTALSAGVEIVCTTCYIKGLATAQLTFTAGFNTSQIFRNFTSQVENEIENITTTAIDYVKNYTTSLVTDITSGDFSLSDLDFPPIPFDFEITVPSLPECQLHFQFDGLELYMQFDTTLSGGATYTLNLYESETPIGVSAGQDNEIGIIFSIDLILSAQAEIDISSGFHIKLNDGVAINMTMFGKNVSSITLNGGSFEFLPVTVQSAGVVLTAILRIGARAGFNVGSPELDFSSGAEVGVWANIAEFITNVTAGTGSCEISVEEVYSMAIGAQAGATLAIADHTWGPTPNTSTVVFYTTLASVCAGNSTATTSSGATLTARAAAATGLTSTSLTTTTLSTKVTYTGIACLSTGLVNCPVSLQTTSKYTTTKTLVTSVPSGSKATFPATTVNSVANTIAFGTNVKALESSSGIPTSYVPTATASSKIEGILDGKTGGVSNKIIIGVSVGGGLLVLLAVSGGCVLIARRKKARRQEMSASGKGLPASYMSGSQQSIKRSPKVSVREFR